MCPSLTQNSWKFPKITTVHATESLSIGALTPSTSPRPFTIRTRTPHSFIPTNHELYFLARYYTDRQLYARHLDVEPLGARFTSKVDAFADIRINEIAMILGIEVIEEIRMELLSAWRTKLGEYKWEVFMAYALDDSHEK